MLDREWVSLRDPDDDHDRYVFDVSFLLSSYTCIYGRGCSGIGAAPSTITGCCTLGAHYVDAEDRARIEASVELLGPGSLQSYADARRRGVTARVHGDELGRTRIRDGACIFLNREGWHEGPGCALHQYAVARGEHHMTHKPEVCWIVPLRRLVEPGTADDGQPCWTTTITSFDRGAWGPGGADFGWWCTDSSEAYVGAEPLYRSMAAELTAMSSEAVYAELAAYLDDRRSRARRPLPFPVFVRR